MNYSRKSRFLVSFIFILLIMVFGVIRFFFVLFLELISVTTGVYFVSWTENCSVYLWFWVRFKVG